MFSIKRLSEQLKIRPRLSKKHVIQSTLAPFVLCINIKLEDIVHK